MQIDTNSFSWVPGGAALLGLVFQWLRLSKNEGAKEQRLVAVEQKVASLAPLEVRMAEVATKVGALDGKIDGIKSDIRGDISDLRTYLMAQHRAD